MIKESLATAWMFLAFPPCRAPSAISIAGFDGVGYYGFWWSASECGGECHDTEAYRMFMSHDSEDAYCNNYGKFSLQSVRCVQGEAVAANTPAPAAAESGSGVKLLASMTETNHNGYVETVKFEYDSKDRIVKIHSGSDEETITLTLHYDGNKLMKKTSSRGDNFNEDYMEGDMVTLNDIPVTLNKEGYIVSTDGLDGGGTDYSYKNGNHVKLIITEAHEPDSTSEKSEIVYKYDSKNSPFFNCKTPKWFLQRSSYTNANTNNVTAETYKRYDSANNLTSETERTYVYEYDSDGFPTKRTETVKSDGKTYTTTTTFTYIGKQ
jgi:hypothetical protein